MPHRAKSSAVFIVAAMFIGCTLSRLGAQARGSADHERTSNHAAALTAQGQEAFQNGQLDEAKRLLQEAVRLEPRSARAHALLGLTLARQEDIEGALANLKQARQIEPGNPDYAYDFAVLSVQARQFAAAVPILEALHRQSPQSDDVLVNLARACAGAAEFGKLSTLIASLPAADYRNESLLKTLATVLAAARQNGTLERMWQAAIHQDHNQPLPYAALAELWTAQGHASRALNLLESAPTAARGPLYLYALGQSQLALRNYSEASESFREITRLMPGSEQAWLQLIRSYLSGNQVALAETSAEDAARRFPGTDEFKYLQSVADYMLNRSAAAMEALAPVIHKAEQNDPRPVLLMAVLLSESGKYQEAMDYFERAQKLELGCGALAAYFYGATLLRAHRPQDAAAQLQAAIRCRPHFALAEYRLGQGLEQSGKPRE
ncbi:MAG: tetratricopeptide repeat protein, partial [Terriglobia bacterium]